MAHKSKEDIELENIAFRLGVTVEAIKVLDWEDKFKVVTLYRNGALGYTALLKLDMLGIDLCKMKDGEQ